MSLARAYARTSSLDRKRGTGPSSSPSRTSSKRRCGGTLAFSPVHHSVVDGRHLLAALVGEREADHDEHHAPAATRLLVDVVQRRDPGDPIPRPERHTELDVLRRVEAHPEPESGRQILGKELPPPEAHAVGRVADQVWTRLDVARRGLAERAREGDELVGAHRLVLGTIELLAENRAVELERHRPNEARGSVLTWQAAAIQASSVK